MPTTLMENWADITKYSSYYFAAFLFPNTLVGDFLADVQYRWKKYERGSIPTPIELLVIFWVQGTVYIFQDSKLLAKDD